MLNAVRRLLAPPKFDDPDKTSAAQVLHWILMILLVMGLIALIILIVGAPSRIPLAVAALAITIADFFFLRQGKLRVASLVLVGFMWLLITFTTYMGYGLYSTFVSLYAMLIIAAVILLSEHVAFGIAVLSILSVIGMAIGHRMGLIATIRENPPIPETAVAVYTVLFASSGTLIYFTAQRIRAAFVYIQQNEQTLNERNRELQRQISERQQIETERDRFFELSLDMMGIANSEGYFTRVNPAFEKTLGYTSEELIASPFITLVHPDDVESTRNEFATIVSGTISYVFENRYRCKDGSYKWLSWSSQPYNGSVYAVARDISESKKAVETLRANAESYRMLFENTGLPTFIYSREGKILMINTHGAAVLRVPAEAAIGKALDDFFPRPQVALFYERIQRVINSSVSEIHEDVVEMGEFKRWYLTNFQPLHDGQGDAYAVQVIIHDVTKLKVAEAQQNELVRAKEKSTFLTEFLGNISHDLKTPITLINTSLYLLERIDDPKRQRDKIQQINEQVELLEKFIQDILMVSRLEYLPTLNREVFNVNMLLSSITTRLYAKIEKKQITVNLDLKDDIPPILADYEQLDRAFVNLIENALNYTPNSGKVDVRAYAKDAHVIVEVVDTGIGIDAEDLPHIFERFYRSDKARSLEQGGTGLGLAIVKRVIDMHECEIAVSSIMGQGTTFRVQIPAQQVAQVT